MQHLRARYRLLLVVPAGTTMSKADKLRKSSPRMYEMFEQYASERPANDGLQEFLEGYTVPEDGYVAARPVDLHSLGLAM